MTSGQGSIFRWRNAQAPMSASSHSAHVTASRQSHGTPVLHLPLIMLFTIQLLTAVTLSTYTTRP